MTELLNTGNDTEVTPAMLALPLLPPHWTAAEQITACSWADEEISRATARHPGSADLLWHCHRLLVPTDERMIGEFAYRSHCYELLDRAAAGRGTRRATAAELVIAAGRLTEQVPLSVAARGMLRRWYRRAFPGLPQVVEPLAARSDELAVDVLEDQVMDAVRTLTATRRLVPVPVCAGRHGTCRYIRHD